MKIIDLLNKIENGENIPQTIKVDGTVYKLDILEYFYQNGNGDDLLQLAMKYNTPNLLNMEVELIEDETIDIDNIEELLKIEEYEVDKTDTVINRNKINELVQAVKQLNKEIKSIKEK